MLFISGSLREGSTNTALLRTAATAAPEGITTVLYNGLDDLPYYSPDRDVDPLSPAVVALRSQLKTADAVLFSTPEYAGALPGGFKNVLDWMVGGGEMDGMPVAWVNVSSPAAPTGGADAHHSLRKVLGYLNAKIVEEACARIPLQRSDIGPDNLIRDPAICQQLTKVLTQLANSGG